MIDWSLMQDGETRQSNLRAYALADAQEGLALWFEAEAARITGPVALAEKLSWTAKESAARAWQAARATPAEEDLLLGEATVTGESLENLTQSILATADAFRGQIAVLTGLRRNASLALRQAATPEEIGAVLASVRLKAQALLP